MALFSKPVQQRGDVDSAEPSHRSTPLGDDHLVTRLDSLEPVLELPTKLSYSNFRHEDLLYTM
jgi:hypothetical protein